MNLSLETAKEMYKSDIPSIKQFALDNYHEEELKQLDFPKTWEDLRNVSGDYIDDCSRIWSLEIEEAFKTNKNTIPDGLGQSVLDLIQLLQVRDRYRKIEGYTFRKYNVCDPITDMGRNMFGFSNRKTADKFEENFKEQLISVSKLYK